MLLDNEDDANGVVITEHSNIQSISFDIYERSDAYFAKILEEVMRRTVPVLESVFLEPGYVETYNYIRPFSLSGCSV